MNEPMKKLMLILGLLMFNVMVWAGNDKPIAMEKMPEKAQLFVKQHFANAKVALSKTETDILNRSYNVIFTNGDKVEFDKRGNWTDVDCQFSQVPVEIIPELIRTYVTNTYPDATYKKIEKDGRGYEVKLSNGWELKFDRSFRLVDLDD